MALDEALPETPEKIYKETITKFQPSKIRGQRELGAPKRKKGEPKPKVQNVRIRAEELYQ